MSVDSRVDACDLIEVFLFNNLVVALVLGVLSSYHIFINRLVSYEWSSFTFGFSSLISISNKNTRVRIVHTWIQCISKTMERSTLILKLKFVNMTGFNKPSKCVLSCFLLLCLKWIFWSYLYDKDTTEVITQIQHSNQESQYAACSTRCVQMKYKRWPCATYTQYYPSKYQIAP